MNQSYGFIWPPGREPFMIDPDGKRISLFVNGDIPYVRVGSSKSLAHDDAEAAALEVLKNVYIKEKVAAAAHAVPGEIEGEEEDDEHDRPPDPDPREVPGEEVPSEEAGRPPDPPGGGVGDIPPHRDDDEREIQVEVEEHHQERPRLVLSKLKRTPSLSYVLIVIGILIANHAFGRR